MISINIYEIAMQMINFLILLFLMNKFMIKPLSAFLEKRANAIKEDISTAESGRLEVEKLLNEQKEIFQQAREEAKAIRQQAEESSRIEKEQVVAAAKQEAERVLQEARRDIENDIEKAKNDLRSETGELAVLLSKQILKREINSKDQEAFVSEALGQLQSV